MLQVSRNNCLQSPKGAALVEYLLLASLLAFTILVSVERTIKEPTKQVFVQMVKATGGDIRDPNWGGSAEKDIGNPRED